MRMTRTKDGKLICNRHHGKGVPRFFVEVPDDTKCSICTVDEIIMDYGIVAYRGWNLDFNNSKLPINLSSLVAYYVWTPRVRQEINGNLGFYSIKLLRPILHSVIIDSFRLHKYEDELLDTQVTIKKEIDIPASILNTEVQSYYPQVVGSVYLWGQFIEYKYGYRAQYCYPKHLWIVDKNLHHLAEDVGNLYGIPCEIYEEGEE